MGALQMTNISRLQFYTAYSTIRKAYRRATYSYKAKSIYSQMWLVLDYLDSTIVTKAFICLTNRGALNG